MCECPEMGIVVGEVYCEVWRLSVGWANALPAQHSLINNKVKLSCIGKLFRSVCISEAECWADKALAQPTAYSWLKIAINKCGQLAFSQRADFLCCSNAIFK